MTVWRSRIPEACIRVLDAEAVVFDRDTGDTHHLDARATAVLDALMHAGPCTAPALYERFVPTAELSTSLTDDILAELERIGLVASSS